MTNELNTLTHIFIRSKTCNKSKRLYSQSVIENSVDIIMIFVYVAVSDLRFSIGGTNFDARDAINNNRITFLSLFLFYSFYSAVARFSVSARTVSKLWMVTNSDIWQNNRYFPCRLLLALSKYINIYVYMLCMQYATQTAWLKVMKRVHRKCHAKYNGIFETGKLSILNNSTKMQTAHCIQRSTYGSLDMWIV